MRLERGEKGRLLLHSREGTVVVLRAVLVVACLGLYVVGWLTVLQIVWLGVLLLVVATALAIPANALMRAQIQVPPSVVLAKKRLGKRPR